MSKDELTILMTNVMTGIAKVSKSPMPKIAQIEKKSEAIFRTCDIDGNGEISLKEFKMYVRKDK
jgi:Ca2+-binding EF-hand superfamily protein